jgi:hypothetical protein
VVEVLVTVRFAVTLVEQELLVKVTMAVEEAITLVVEAVEQAQLVGLLQTILEHAVAMAVTVQMRILHGQLQRPLV